MVPEQKGPPPPSRMLAGLGQGQKEFITNSGVTSHEGVSVGNHSHTFQTVLLRG